MSLEVSLNFFLTYDIKKHNNKVQKAFSNVWINSNKFMTENWKNKNKTSLINFPKFLPLYLILEKANMNIVINSIYIPDL